MKMTCNWIAPAIDVDFYDVFEADVDEPESEFFQFNFTDSDNSTNGNTDWKEA